MSGSLEILDERGERTRVRVTGEPLIVCGGTLCVTACVGGVLVKPAAEGATLRVQGRTCRSAQFAHGDAADVGRVRLTWFDDEADPTARERGRAATRARQRPVGRVWPAVGITFGVVVAMFFVLRAVDDSTLLRSPDYFLNLAEAQCANERFDLALQTLAFAESGASPEESRRARGIAEKIHRLQRQRAAAVEVAAAESARGLLRSFERRYLTTPSRAAARELVRLCDEWSERYAALRSEHPDAAAMLEDVSRIRAQHVEVAALGSPDVAGDVVFAAKSRMRFIWRDYRGAVERLDAFLATHADDAVVLTARADLLRDGRVWLDKRLRRVDAALERGDLENAARDIASLERWVAISEWRDDVAARKARLDVQR